MTMRKSSRRTRKPRGIRAGSTIGGPRTQDAEGRVVVRTLETVSREKATFVEWLNTSGNTPQRLAEQMAKLKTSADPRVALRAVELEARIRGFEDDRPEKGAGVLIINVGVPEIARLAPVVAAAPTLPSNGVAHETNGKAHP